MTLTVGVKRRIVLIVAMSALAAACGSRQAVPSAALLASSSATPLCMGGQPFAPGAAQPIWVEVTNATDRDLRVLSDSCVRRTLLGTVTADQTARFRIPEHVFEFEGALRFHTYTTAPSVRFGSYATPIEVPTVTLRVGESTPTIAGVEASDSLDLDRWLSPIHSSARGEREVASVFASGTQSVLTWLCLEGDVVVTFTATLDLAGDPEIVASTSNEEFRSFGTWSVIDHITDAALAPNDVVSEFTAFVRDHTWISVRASTEPDIPQGHVFSLRGLSDALDRLPCLR